MQNTSLSDAVSVTETLIIGAGPAGLATAGCLRKQKQPFTLVEQADAIGSSWRRHYERLHLHTARQHSALPFLAFPRGTPRYPSRAQLIEYLELYARHFQIDPLFGCRALSLKRGDDRWIADTSTGCFRARRVVVATGVNALPKVPSWPGRERYRGEIIHSSDYRNGEPFRHRRVLVAGFGNSAGEIAVDLHEHGARVMLAVRDAVNVVPRDILGLPILSVSIGLSWLPSKVADALAAPLVRLTLGNIEQLGLRKSVHGPLTEIAVRGRVPLLDHGTLRLIRAGNIEVMGEVTELGETSAHFRDGGSREVDAIIAATGFRSELEHLLEPPELPSPASKARHPGSTADHGLYFCGFAVSGTGMLRDIGIEARRIAHHIAHASRSNATPAREPLDRSP